MDSHRFLFWAPRALCLLFIGFVSLFALDVFQEGHGFWSTLIDLTIHLIPSFLMLGALIVAWRREWVGAVVFTAAAIFFGVIVRGTWWVKGMFVVPCLLTAWLFFRNWQQTDAHGR